MNGDFGKFIEQKRKSNGMTLRGLAAALEIAPAFMSDIEKGHRYPPKKETLDKLADVLHFTEDDRYLMFDLAAKERENAVSSDLAEYIMGNDDLRLALRKARTLDNAYQVWKKVIDMIEEEAKKNTQS